MLAILMYIVIAGVFAFIVVKLYWRPEEHMPWMPEEPEEDSPEGV